MAKNVAIEIWNYGELSVYKHSSGVRRFAVWDGQSNLCWCDYEEDALKIAKALIRAPSPAMLQAAQTD